MRIAPYPVRITELAEALLQATGSTTMKKPNVVRINNWLEQQGLMTKEPTPDGKSRRVPTAAGRNLGLSTQMRQSPDGEYLAISYSTNAQRFVLDHLYEILQK